MSVELRLVAVKASAFEKRAGTPALEALWLVPEGRVRHFGGEWSLLDELLRGLPEGPRRDVLVAACGGHTVTSPRIDSSYGAVAYNAPDQVKAIAAALAAVSDEEIAVWEEARERAAEKARTAPPPAMDPAAVAEIRALLAKDPGAQALMKLFRESEPVPPPEPIELVPPPDFPFEDRLAVLRGVRDDLATFYAEAAVENGYVLVAAT